VSRARNKPSWLAIGALAETGPRALHSEQREAMMPLRGMRVCSVLLPVYKMHSIFGGNGVHAQFFGALLQLSEHNHQRTLYNVIKIKVERGTP
jgi:hypothetical protein